MVSTKKPPSDSRVRTPFYAIQKEPLAGRWELDSSIGSFVDDRCPTASAEAQLPATDDLPSAPRYPGQIKSISGALLQKLFKATIDARKRAAEGAVREVCIAESTNKQAMECGPGAAHTSFCVPSSKALSIRIRSKDGREAIIKAPEPPLAMPKQDWTTKAPSQLSTRGRNGEEAIVKMPSLLPVTAAEFKPFSEPVERSEQHQHRPQKQKNKKSKQHSSSDKNRSEAARAAAEALMSGGLPGKASLSPAKPASAQTPMKATRVSEAGFEGTFDLPAASHSEKSRAEMQPTIESVHSGKDSTIPKDASKAWSGQGFEEVGERWITPGKPKHGSKQATTRSRSRMASVKSPDLANDGWAAQDDWHQSAATKKPRQPVYEGAKPDDSKYSTCWNATAPSEQNAIPATDAWGKAEERCARHSVASHHGSMWLQQSAKDRWSGATPKEDGYDWNETALDQTPSERSVERGRKRAPSTQTCRTVSQYSEARFHSRAGSHASKQPSTVFYVRLKPSGRQYQDKHTSLEQVGPQREVAFHPSSTRDDGGRAESYAHEPHLQPPTVFAGKGWISPHPLSVSPTEFASPPQSKIILPSEAFHQGATMTYQEWKEIRERGMRTHRNFSHTDSSQRRNGKFADSRYRFAGWGVHDTDSRRFEREAFDAQRSRAKYNGDCGVPTMPIEHSGPHAWSRRSWKPLGYYGEYRPPSSHIQTGSIDPRRSSQQGGYYDRYRPNSGHSRVPTMSEFSQRHLGPQRAYDGRQQSLRSWREQAPESVEEVRNVWSDDLRYDRYGSDREHLQGYIDRDENSRTATSQLYAGRYGESERSRSAFGW